MAYLEALGIDSYVSRNQLPGAALTRRLAIVSARATAVSAGVASDARSARVPSALLDRAAAVARPGSGTVARSDNVVASPAQGKELPQRDAAVPRFSLIAIIAGNWLWLEDGAHDLRVWQWRGTTPSGAR